ncbi:MULTISPECIES: gas vesicle protein GvpJ [unclassified Streptomyces]|uniref:gas vesicle protein GvpJ n=1 Tax=unclassified Streptomyces TaxID=2593676 RepID=UPI002E793768|nr:MULTISPECIES: gas vesicle protein GvpJ [unclassified Streptomyces]MEE1758434.1 gas vesicle protein [Streptomyces sp. SP18BB07]MEE1830122.1 gas vesicle protein [Streptomyces sp. SP17KL33]
MTQSGSASPVPSSSRGAYPYGGGQGSSANLADILERVLDKGIVIVGDIKINLLDIELLTIKLRLLVASVDKAKEIGIDWWEHDPALSSRASRSDGRRSLADENERLRAEVKELRRRVEESPRELSPSASTERPRREPRRKEAAEATRPPEPRRKRRKPVNVDAEDEGDDRGSRG